MEATINRRDLEEGQAPATISDAQHLSSYSWIDCPEPTIAVPGIPPKWQPPKTRRRLPKDSGLRYIAQNAARHPDSPMEPLFRALCEADPTFDVRGIDVVTDRNNMRKLLSFIDPTSDRYGMESFIIHAELAGGKTVILSRVEPQTHEFIGRNKFKGHGHEFEKAYTTCEIPNSTGHHRIIRYCFGGLSYVVRFEVDAYVDAGDPVDEKPLADLKYDSRLTVRKQGRIIPSESTLEIKTRVAHKPMTISDLASQLWSSQTPKLVRAYHHNGLFGKEAHVQDVAYEIAGWERAQQPQLKKLAALMTKLTDLVKGFGGSCLIRCSSEGAEELVLQKTEDGKPMLPSDLYVKWAT
ncbi:hypothetical protein PG991_001912 [Apiospora marii]|uniref:Geranylgeranyl pyrophosphate synthetase n=1 Tax=Apiospora marii TaxID=335849 RepID=A0ABR1SQ50_9PEZI